jgi:hypothetical protein
MRAALLLVRVGSGTDANCPLKKGVVRDDKVKNRGLVTQPEILLLDGTATEGYNMGD